MENEIHESATRELDAIQKDLTFVRPAMYAKRKKAGALYIDVPGKGAINVDRMFSERRKALRVWLIRWGKKLKAEGYRVVSNNMPLMAIEYRTKLANSGVFDREVFDEPVFTIEDPLIPDEKADEVSEFLAEEKIKNISAHKHQKSNRLGKRPEE